MIRQPVLGLPVTTVAESIGKVLRNWESVAPCNGSQAEHRDFQELSIRFGSGVVVGGPPNKDSATLPGSKRWGASPALRKRGDRFLRIDMSNSVNNFGKEYRYAPQRLLRVLGGCESLFLVPFPLRTDA